MCAAKAPAVPNDFAVVVAPAIPIRVGVIGQGNWGTRLAAALRASPRFQVQALCDSRPERLPLGTEERVTCRAEELFRWGLEAVVIATNPVAHAQLAVRALEEGHHVLVEKPCAVSSDEAERIHGAARKTGLVAGVGHLLRYHAAYERLIELSRSGEFGEIQGVVAERVGSRPRDDVDAWWMLAPHDLSILNALFGSAPVAARRWCTAEDEFVGAVQFDTAPATLVVRSGGATSRRIAVLGSRWTAIFDDMRKPACIRLVATEAPELRELALLARGSCVTRRSSAQGIASSLDAASAASAIELEVPSKAPPLERQLHAFADAIRADAPLAADMREGLAVVRTLELASRDKCPSGMLPVVARGEASMALER